MDIKIKDKFNLWKEEIRLHKRLITLSLILLIISTFLDLLSGNYVLEAGVAVSPDIILDHLGPYNFQFLFGWMYLLIMVCLFFFPLFFKITELHKVISQFSLLIIMRSFFIAIL